MRSILLICIILTLIISSCGGDTPEQPAKETPESELPHRPPEITYVFGDSESPSWETRIKPGMSQTELLKVWGKPWSAYKYPRTITSPERDVWCYYTLDKDFAIVSWAYDPQKWDALPELYSAIWGKGSGEKLGTLGDVTIYGAINGDKYVTDEAEIKRLFNYLYINYWKVKLI